MDIKIVNTATPFFERIAHESPREFRRALKSAGWWLRGEIKSGIRASAPGGQPYTHFSSITTERLLRKKGQRKRVHRPMGRLYSATIYRYYGDSMRVIVGWVTRSAERVGLKQEHGHTTEITPRMRRFFWAAGIPLSKHKKTLAIPKRPTIDPEYQAKAPKVPGYMARKIDEYFERAKKS
jgi:hypothetical protein